MLRGWWKGEMNESMWGADKPPRTSGSRVQNLWVWGFGAERKEVLIHGFQVGTLSLSSRGTDVIAGSFHAEEGGREIWWEGPYLTTAGWTDKKERNMGQLQEPEKARRRTFRRMQPCQHLLSARGGQGHTLDFPVSEIMPLLSFKPLGLWWIVPIAIDN